MVTSGQQFKVVGIQVIRRFEYTDWLIIEVMTNKIFD